MRDISFTSQCYFKAVVKQRIALFVFVIFATLLTKFAHAEYITQVDIEQTSVVNSVYIKLLEKDAPLNVQNFRNYVAAGDYTNTFFHRSIKDFIVQGGGFTFDSTLNNGTFSYNATIDPQLGGLQLILEALPVDSEFGNSNLRGTVAMAKLSGNPDSATSQWFFNLDDNSANLDFQNGGFTVFAEVLGDGMDVIDAIANQDVVDRRDVHSAFSSLPLLNFSVGDSVTENNLIRVKSITEVLSISSDINYGTVTLGSNLQPEIVILNVGNDPVSIGDIGGQDPVASPFSVESDLCSNKILLPGQRCAFIALFSPTEVGIFDDSFDVEFPDLGINYLINLSAVGGGAVVEPDFSSSFSSVDFETLAVLSDLDESPYKWPLVIKNFGGADLNLFSIALSSDSDTEFTVSNIAFENDKNCLSVNTLASNERCIIQISYLPLVGGSHTAKLIIESDDPDETPFEIPIFAVADPDIEVTPEPEIPLDADGIDKAVEDAALNNGDGNNDGIFDREQSNVASLPDLKGAYNTYLSSLNLNQFFTDVRIVKQNDSDENPDNIILDAGVHEFTIVNIAPGAIAQVGLLLPVGVSPSAYYIYGATSENGSPLWYQFDDDGETGATLIGVATVTSPTGKRVQRNLISLRIKNGGRGDSSNLQDASVTVKSGVRYSSSSNSGSDSGGHLSFFFLQFIVLITLLLRTKRNFNKV